ncbi:unnamed protein product [Trichogramma brassicae]|uniref:Uncharacterized protein n=1 Tax=Trichogramma brassicae TaxID=86971 RepID=A0A6H5HWU6_9HYME|nr:unnamed protein product [Trichogramma brassicae]
MALYDNAHWLLSHIRDSFISTDDTGTSLLPLFYVSFRLSRYSIYSYHCDITGLCEIVMAKDDIPRELYESGSVYVYPGAEDSDEEDLDALSDSYDILMDMEFSHRARTNTAQRLEKMDLEKKRAAKIKHIKWENPQSMSSEEQQEMFNRKELHMDKPVAKQKSLFSEMLEKCPDLPKNPFTEYAKFDGNLQIGVPIRKYRIFMCMLPKELRAYPFQVMVLATAKVQEFIGYICYKYTSEHPNTHIHEDISKYGLYITEDDGEIDWDFPCLDPIEVISKFEFSTLGLVEMKPSDKARHKTTKVINQPLEERESIDKTPEDAAKDLAKMQIHTTAMEAPQYQLYRYVKFSISNLIHEIQLNNTKLIVLFFRVYIINKVRAKIEVHLGISGDKIEIDPVNTGKGASKFWMRQRAVSYHIDNVAWCELGEQKGSKTTFTLVYTPHNNLTLDGFNVSLARSQSFRRSASFKNYDFEAGTVVAEEIVSKINHILQLRSSSSRKEYIAQKERKASRRKSFHIHR